MNTNDPEIGAMVAREIRRGFRDVHDNIRKLISGMDVHGLNWKPHPEANSIAVLVTHTLGSEREMLAAVRGISVPRDRPSEFITQADRSQLEQLIDQGDEWLNQQTHPLTAQDLTANRPRGDRPPQPGLVWLITNYGHAREHLAQMELTKQLYLSSRE
jgi:DinB family protein